MQHHDNDHRRRHTVVVSLLAAIVLIGSLLLPANLAITSDDASRRPRQLAAFSPKARRPRRPRASRFSDPKTVVPRVDAAAVAATAGGPNVIYLQHEALSGGIALHTKEGVASMPYFQDKMKRDPDFYAFAHARTVSGISMDAMPALMTGCLPYTKVGLKWAHAPGRSVGFEFKQSGYHTASFCSRPLDGNMKKGHWSELYNVLVEGMDKVVEPLSQKWHLHNKHHDRKMLSEFQAWLTELDNHPRPFYAQFYNFNQHYPYARKKGAPKSSHRYFQSLYTTDEFLRGLFDILEKAGRLQNTIVVGSGNFGDEPFKAKFASLQALSSNILQPLSYIYYPQHLLPDSDAAARLRGNTQRVMHTLDLHPTIRGVLHRVVAANGGEYVPPHITPGGCITGLDLTAVNVPEDRVVLSWNLFSAQNVPWSKKRQLWALSTQELTLYHRLHKKPHPQLQQGTDDAYVLHYGECLRNTSSANLCQTPLTEEYSEYFRNAIQWIKDTSLYDEGVKTSHLVEFFGKMVNWKEREAADVAD